MKNKGTWAILAALTLAAAALLAQVTFPDLTNRTSVESTDEFVGYRPGDGVSTSDSRWSASEVEQYVTRSPYSLHNGPATAPDYEEDWEDGADTMSWANQSDAAITYHGGSALLVTDAAGGIRVRWSGATIPPGVDWGWFGCGDGYVSSTGSGFGLAALTGGTTASPTSLRTIFRYRQTTTAGDLSADAFSNYTTYSGSIFSSQDSVHWITSPVCWAITYDTSANTTFFWYSENGFSWDAAGSAVATPTDLGIAAGDNVSAAWFHWVTLVQLNSHLPPFEELVD